MSTLRELKGRIGSVSSSEKITGAMKMISSAKMHKAENALRRLVPFRNQINDIIANLLGSDAQFSSPLLAARHVSKMAVVVWGSDDGLCGAYNINIVKQLIPYLVNIRQMLGKEVVIDIIAIGRKMHKACRVLADVRTHVVSMPGVDSKTDGDAVNTFLQGLIEDFTGGRYDRIDTMYMSYKSVSRQRLETQQLLPILFESFSQNSGRPSDRPYIFEPGPGAIFNSVLPMYLMATTQEIFTENRASEQAARVMAMQSANDNAKKLLDQLRLEYNKLRQQSITTELLDIVGGQVRD